MSELSETGGDYNEPILSNRTSHSELPKNESKKFPLNNLSNSSSSTTSNLSDITAIEERLKSLVNLNLNSNQTHQHSKKK